VGMIAGNALLFDYLMDLECYNGSFQEIELGIFERFKEKKSEKIKDNITGQASDGWAEGFEQREISTEMGDIYISFWNSDNWFIKTAEEMGIEDNQKMGGMKFE
jgi:hypothetical protein